MGVAFSSFAVRNKSPEVVRKELRLQSTGEYHQYTKATFTGVKLPGEWYLILHRQHEFTDAELQNLSASCEVIALFVEEHVMVSKAACWKNGEEIWWVMHDSDKDLMHLDARGSLPPQYARIRDELLAKRLVPNPCDYIFDIPVSLVADITGFRYDENHELPFEVLKGPSLLRRILNF
jgi:hypothetical protein